MPDDSSHKPVTAQHIAAAPFVPTADRAAIKPFAFIWHYARRHGRARLSGILTLAFVGAIVDNLQPYALGALVNALAVISGAALPIGDSSGAHQATLWFAVLCAIWIVGPILSRVHTLASTKNMLALKSCI